jgi:succinate dehydrogenase flavin-adding protein (antitoxin of CptAB toxin-antitoxin module)
MDRAAHDRLRWRCRRGLLELDIVLERFLKQYATGMGEEDLAALAGLLEFEDNDLWDVVNGRSERYDPKYRSIVARLRAI